MTYKRQFYNMERKWRKQKSRSVKAENSLTRGETQAELFSPQVKRQALNRGETNRKKKEHFFSFLVGGKAKHR